MKVRTVLACVLVLLLALGIVLTLRWRAAPPAVALPSGPADPRLAGESPQADRTSAWTEGRESSGERPRPKPREGVDAANLYADAFGLYDQLTDEEKKMIRQATEEVDADAAARLFEKVQPILELLRAAAKADYSDWGTGEITFATALPHLVKAQQLGSVAVWASAYRFPSDPATALDDLGALSRLGHHLSDTMIGALVSGSLEGRVSNLLSQHLGTLDGAMLDKARALTSGSTIDADLTRAFRGETSAGEAFWRSVKAAGPRERGRMLAAITGASAEEADWVDSAKHLATGLLTDWTSIENDLAFIRRVQEQAAEKMRAPDAEFRALWEAIERETQTGKRPLARIGLPTLTSFQQHHQKLRIDRALLSAAADIFQHGPAQIGRHRDPATGGPIAYVPTATGFELRSPYVVKGKPVTMSFTKP